MVTINLHKRSDPKYAEDMIQYLMDNDLRFYEEADIIRIVDISDDESIALTTKSRFWGREMPPPDAKQI